MTTPSSAILSVGNLALAVAARRAGGIRSIPVSGRNLILPTLTQTGEVRTALASQSDVTDAWRALSSAYPAAARETLERLAQMVSQSAAAAAPAQATAKGLDGDGTDSFPAPVDMSGGGTSGSGSGSSGSSTDWWKVTADALNTLKDIFTGSGGGSSSTSGTQTPARTSTAPAQKSIGDYAPYILLGLVAWKVLG